MKQLSKMTILVWLLVFFLFNCSGGKDNAENGDPDAYPQTTSVSQTGNEHKEKTEKAKSVHKITTANQEIPVYRTFDELQHIFEQKNDTTYVINFWATWCKPCVEELPYFDRLHDQYEDEKVRVILVSLDFERDLETKLVDFINKRQLKSEVMVLLDGNANEWIDKVNSDWGGAIPVTIVYRAEERVFIGQQLHSFEELLEIVRSML